MTPLIPVLKVTTIVQTMFSTTATDTGTRTPRETICSFALLGVGYSVPLTRNMTTLAHDFDTISRLGRSGIQSAVDTATRKAEQSQVQKCRRHQNWLHTSRDRMMTNDERSLADVVLSQGGSTVQLQKTVQLLAQWTRATSRRTDWHTKMQ